MTTDDLENLNNLSDEVEHAEKFHKWAKNNPGNTEKIRFINQNNGWGVDVPADCYKEIADTILREAERHLAKKELEFAQIQITALPEQAR